ncbi:MAG: phosphoribosylglycinamide formyltransferase [Firmicutes bacterium]|nr:phosphoribosylglycinamide formyltransferase [Bacillota bacterium]
MLNIAVFVSGGGTNLQNLIDADLPNGHISLVVSSSEKTYALQRAKKHKIETIIFNNKDDENKILGVLKEKNIGLIVLAGYLNILSPYFIKKFVGTIINIHPSLLPEYGGFGMYGLKVHKAVIADGKKISGATVHLVSEEPDAGKILDQIKVPVFIDDTPISLQLRIMELGEKILLPRVVKDLTERSN